jgi:hypothetical protein
MDETNRNISDASLAGADDVPQGTGRLSGMREEDTLRQWRPRRRRTRVLVAAGAVAALAAGGVTTALLAASASPTPTPLAALTSAVARTSADSYRFRLDSTVRFAGREIRSDAVTGTLDPSHDLGAESLTVGGGNSAGTQVRFIGKYVYTSVPPGSALGKPWNQAPVPPSGADVLPVDDVYGFSTEQPVSPAELLRVLRSPVAVREEGPASGPGWTGIRYAFTARLSLQASLAGTVYVDQQGLVRRLVTTTRQGMELRLTTDRDFTLSDFGIQVPVVAPPARQVKYTSSGPYLGIFF